MAVYDPHETRRALQDVIFNAIDQLKQYAVETSILELEYLLSALESSKDQVLKELARYRSK